MKNWFLIISLTLIHLTIRGQQTQSAIRMTGKCFGDSIVLRWAPADPATWQTLNKYGYRLERYTIIRDSAILDPKPVKSLNEKPILPAPESEWTKWMQKDQAAAVAAQAIFGTSFELTNSGSSDMIEILNRSKELDSRYSFALFSADISAIAANLSGLRWVDRDIKKNERYLYRVYSLAPEKEGIEMGFVYISGKNSYKFPIPRKPVTIAKEYNVQLIFDPIPLNESYTAYQFERSEDGKNFKTLNKLPLIATRKNEGEMGIILSNDTIPSTGKPFYYRIRGISHFGIWGPYSDTTKVITAPAAMAHAVITNCIMNPTGNQLQWKYPVDQQNKIKGFDVERGKSADGQFIKVNSSMIAPDKRSFVDDKPYSTSYYRIVATDLSGQLTRSYPYMVQLDDSIPPSPPVDLIASVDSAGIVHISWRAGTEPDLDGYHIYRSNFKSSEFSRVSKELVTENNFYDTVNLKTLTNKVYYKVSALDRRSNPSAFSLIATLRMPDVVPPAAPTIKSLDILEDKVQICWEGISADVKSYQVYRTKKGTNQWSLLQSDPKNENCYRDIPDEESFYQYKIIAEDSSGNKSPSRVVEVTYRKAVTASLKLQRPTANRELKEIRIRWTYNSTAQKFIIYRAANDEAPALFATVTGTTRDFIDSKVLMDTNYKYWIKAVAPNGSYSPTSEPAEIKY